MGAGGELTEAGLNEKRHGYGSPGDVWAVLPSLAGLVPARQPKLMKRYAIFSWAEYQQIGGWSDFDRSHETLQDAIDSLGKVKVRGYCWQVVDLTTGVVVQEGEGF